jgi:hypothetical protein
MEEFLRVFLDDF